MSRSAPRHEQQPDVRPRQQGEQPGAWPRLLSRSTPQHPGQQEEQPGAWPGLMSRSTPQHPPLPAACTRPWHGLASSAWHALGKGDPWLRERKRIGARAQNTERKQIRTTIRQLNLLSEETSHDIAQARWSCNHLKKQVTRHKNVDSNSCRESRVPSGIVQQQEQPLGLSEMTTKPLSDDNKNNH